MKRISFLVLIALLPILMACSGSPSDEEAAKAEKDKEAKEELAKEAVKKKTLPICPQVAIVHELDTLRDYGDEKPDPSQIVAVSRMQNVEGDCGYHQDRKNEGIDIAFDLNLIAQRGPRLGGDRSSFPFFVAVVDPDQNVLDKNKMTTEFKFSDDKKKIVEKTENLHVFIPLPKDKWVTGPKYQVLIGFQLTQAQLDEVRAREPQEPEEKAPPSQDVPQQVTPKRVTPWYPSVAPKTLDQELPADIKPEPQTPDPPAPAQ